MIIDGPLHQPVMAQTDGYCYAQAAMCWISKIDVSLFQQKQNVSDKSFKQLRTKQNTFTPKGCNK
jgi:hypothetical protein